MPIIMSKETVLASLEVLFSQEGQAYKKALMLLNEGVDVSFGLFQFSIKFDQEHAYSVQLPQMSSHIASNTLTVPQQALITKKIEQVIEQAFVYNAMKGSAVKFDDLDKAEIAEVKKVLPTWPTEEPKAKVVKPKPAASIKVDFDEPKPIKTPTAAVVPLKDSTALGQAIKGSSVSSVYRTCAVGPVNLAVKFSANQCSIRAESNNLTSLIRSRLKEVGFTDNGSYLSLHLSLGTVPAMRALGSVIYSIGFNFNQIGTSKEAINA